MLVGWHVFSVSPIPEINLPNYQKTKTHQCTRARGARHRVTTKPHEYVYIYIYIYIYFPFFPLAAATNQIKFDFRHLVANLWPDSDGVHASLIAHAGSQPLWRTPVERKGPSLDDATYW